jgi:hypothetical protein
MFEPTERRGLFDRALDSPAATAMAMLALLMMPLLASSGVTRSEPRPMVQPASCRAADEVARGYQMRCWQHGRLTLEQCLPALPADPSHSLLKVSSSDRFGRPVYMAEMRDATCLIRRLAADAGRAS